MFIQIFLLWAFFVTQVLQPFTFYLYIVCFLRMKSKYKFLKGWFLFS